MRPPSKVPLIADSRLCFSEKPRVSAAKIGARPSGSMMTSRVTNALNTYSMERNCTLQRGARIGDEAPLAPQRPRPFQGLPPDPDLRGPVPGKSLVRERPDHRGHVHRKVPDAPRTERQPEKAVEALEKRPDLVCLRDQQQGFEARGAARDPLGQTGVLDPS